MWVRTGVIPDSKSVAATDNFSCPISNNNNRLNTDNNLSPEQRLSNLTRSLPQEPSEMIRRRVDLAADHGVPIGPTRPLIETRITVQIADLWIISLARVGAHRPSSRDQSRIHHSPSRIRPDAIHSRRKGRLGIEATAGAGAAGSPSTIRGRLITSKAVSHWGRCVTFPCPRVLWRKLHGVLIMQPYRTSELAEESIRPIKGKIDSLVFWYLVTCPSGQTHQQIEERFAHIYQPPTIRWACSRLVKQGLIQNTGRIGYTKSRRLAIVWSVVPSTSDGWLPNKAKPSKSLRDHRIP